MKLLPFEQEAEMLLKKIEKSTNRKEEEILKQQLLMTRKKIESSLDYWQKVQLARHPERPRSSDLLPLIFKDLITIHGDRCKREDESVIAGFGRINNEKLAFIAQEKSRRQENILSTAGIRKAIRILKLAERFNLPIVSIVDNPGTFPGFEREEEGLAYWISEMLSSMYNASTPTIAVVIGEGGSGGAIAFSLADSILMLKYTIFMVIAPEASSVIIYKRTDHTKSVAKEMKILAEELHHLGLIDNILPEPSGGAHWDYQKTADIIREAIQQEVSNLKKMDRIQLLQRRRDKYLKIGLK